MRTHKSIRVDVIRPEIQLPLRKAEGDVGWEVTLLNRKDNRSEDAYQDVNYFLTGIQLPRDSSFYYEIVPKNDLIKMGYCMLGPMVIDSTHGELAIPLYKFKETEDIELPFAAVQLLLHSRETSGFVSGARKAQARPRQNAPQPTYYTPDFGGNAQPQRNYQAQPYTNTSQGNHMY